MPKKKTALDKGAMRLAEIIQAHLDKLPADVAREKRQEFHDMALKASRASKTERHSRPRRTQATRPSSRVRAKNA